MQDALADLLALEVMTDMVPVDDETFALTSSQDVEPILNANKSFHLDSDGYTPSRDMRHVARIPLVVAVLWQERYGVDVFKSEDKPAVRRLLNSSEWAYLRTGGGVI